MSTAKEPSEKDGKEEDQDLVYERIKNSDFKQQRLPAWRPVPTLCSSIIIFEAFGAVFIGVGILLLIFSSKVKEVKTKYIDDQITINIEIKEDMEAPIIIYYQLNGAYQNHRRYMKSKSIDQLHGKSFTLKEMKDTEECDPVYTNKDMGKTKNYDGGELDPNELAVPCGLMAKNYFNDDFTEWKLESGRSLNISQTGIAWKSDKEIIYKNTADKSKQWIDMKNEHFIIWMRPSLTPDFRKKWGIITENLTKGDVITVTVENNYKVGGYKGEKYIILSTMTKLGGKHVFLGISYIVVGGLSIACAVLFVVFTMLGDKKEEGVERIENN